MARRTNIVSAILSGIGGGVEGGLAQRERSLAEEERRRAAEAAARAERLEFLNAGFAPESSAGARDMPGATPRMPFATQEMPGGERLVMMDSPEATKHREKMQDVMKDRRVAESTAVRALAAKEAEDERKIATLVAAGVPDAEARARIVGGYTKPTPPAPRRQLTTQGQIVDMDTGAVQDLPGFKLPPREPREPKTPRETATERQAREIDAAVLQFSRTPQPGFPGMPPTLPTQAQVQQYRQMLRQTILEENATEEQAQTPSMMPAATPVPSTTRSAPASAVTQAPAATPAPAATQVADAENVDAERRGPRRFTNADRADRWDELRRQNPWLSDEQIEAQVRREMP